MKKFNEWFAYKMTLAVSTMWAFYLFVIYGLIPVVFPAIQDKILYWSNFVQLIFLPLLAVGSAVMARATEKRDLETHDTVMKSNEAMMEELQLAKEERQQLTELVKVLHEIQTGNAATDGELQYLHSTLLEELTEVRKVIQSQNGGK